MTARRLILASASPQRQNLLREAGFEFAIHPANVDEEKLSQEAQLAPVDLPVFLARMKAQNVAADYPADVVLAADTIVALRQHVLGKPADAADAIRTLKLLSGSTHEVITGVVLIWADSLRCETVSSTVQMKTLNMREIDAYIASNRWRGKAGGYGLQDADPFILRTSGCMTNIVGLPMTTTARLLREAGIEPCGRKSGT